MKKKHLKLGSCALMASLLTLSSCVDNDYDLTKDIDLTIQVGGSEFAIPGGETEPIKLSKILDIEEDGVVKIDGEGNYYLLQEGSESNTDISVNEFQVEAPDITPIKPELNFTIPPLTGLPPTNIPASLPIESTNFELKGENLPTDITSLSSIDMDMEAVIRFSIPAAIISKLTLKTVELSFPKFINSPRLTNGVLHLTGEEATAANGLTVTIPVDGIDCKQEGVTFTKGNEYSQLLMEGTISLEGEVSINTGDVQQGVEGPVSINLTVEITLQDKLSKQPIINIKSVTGIVQPKIDINIEPVTLSGLPDFLDDEKVTLSVQNPMVFFTAKNNTPVAANVNGIITSFINKGSEEIPVGDPNKPVTFSFKLNREEDQKFCLSPLAPTNMEGITHVEVPNLPTLINKIPDIFKFDVTTKATTDETTVLLGHTYNITTDYDVNVPFVFGKNITTIVYKDSVDGWYDDLKDYEIQQVNATATAFNTIPLGLNLTAKALTVDAAGKAEELKGVAITVIVDGEKDGTIKAGKNNVAAESTLVIEIKETTSGAVKRLDGLAFEIVAASVEGAEGQQLNENQTLQLKNVRLKVPNGVIIDLN
ncbi:hypothetical protein [Bacteroides sp.]|uniref:hypothetical protein n=1 Tax=Bacteroides sp. TaxID=29523 RepID=UPI0025BBA6BB|nr:hypothetical protein [Bacteroides sp.]